MSTENQPTYVSTFNCIGLYWNPDIPEQEKYTCSVLYRKCGDETWSKGLDLWYDGRALNGRPPEFRGSIVGMSPGTSYEVRLTLNNENTTAQTIIASTMSEDFPVKQAVFVGSQNSTLHITEGGDAENGYILYDGTGSTINVDKKYECCIEVSVSWVIIRGFKLINGARHGVKLVNGCQHVVIEECDITEWGSWSGTVATIAGVPQKIGYDFDSAIRLSHYDEKIGHVIIQRNRMYNPTYTANTWDTGHPSGPNGISISTDNNVGHIIIRYNEIFATNGHGYNDCIQGEDNSSYRGCPGPDSDIYGNIIMNSFDDGIEADGGGMNVRIWGNYLDKNAVAISSASNSMGPCYFFRNVANRFRMLFNVKYDEDERLTFLKCGSDNFSGGRRYVFHNTILNPPSESDEDLYSYGPEAGIDQSGDILENTISRNNIIQTWKEWKSYIRDEQLHTNNDFDYDLHNAHAGTFAEGNEAHGIIGVPIYKEGHGYISGSGGLYELAENSPGYHAGIPIDNFNSGSQVDIGAHQSGTAPMEFGVNAYRAAKK